MFNSRLDKKMLTIMINVWGKSGIPSYNPTEVAAQDYYVENLRRKIAPVLLE